MKTVKYYLFNLIFLQIAISAVVLLEKELRSNYHLGIE